jgi:peptidyl-prolyl cis-trans isomerase C
MMTYSQKSTAGAAARALILALASLPLANASWGGQAWAQTAPAPAPVAAPAPPADPVVATVGGEPIHLAEVREAMAGLPAQAQTMPPQTLFPYVLDQLIDSRILTQAARKAGLDKDPAVQRQIAAAADRVLQGAILHRDVDPAVTDAALKVRYDQDIAGHPGELEVHARHILVPDEATAKKVIEALKKGGDFAALSKEYSKDPSASAQGGDLGFFKKGDMVPEFANTAFTLKDGELTQTPVHTQFGWHVIQAIERRQAPPPAFADAKEELRQKVVSEIVQASIAKAKAGVAVEKFNMDGTPHRATDTAEPPPPAK